MIREIEIKKLFGRFDYFIKLSEDGITILTGPNGFGKSTILDIITAIANGNLEYFFNLEFSAIQIFMDNSKESFLIKNIEKDLIINGQTINKLDFMDWKKRRYRVNGQFNLEEADLDQKIHETIFSMKNVVGEIYRIEEQRLIQMDIGNNIKIIDGRRVVDGQTIIQTVNEIPRKLRKRMSEVASEYSSVANKLDSTFPQRLFAQKEGISKDEFDKKLCEMQEKVCKLNKYGISDIGRLEDIQFKEDDARALKVYFDDFQEKYSKYKKLVQQLELFTDIVNKRFKFKKVYVSKELGIYILDDGRTIPLSKLSSGEKETIVLFYQLIFDVQDGIMLLIDEPEISLHIAWQRMFVEDMKKIVEQKRMTALIATHSIPLVSGNGNIQIDLGEQYGKRLNKS